MTTGLPSQDSYPPPLRLTTTRPRTGVEVRSVLSVPVQAHGETAGQPLRRVPQRWDDSQVCAVQAYARLSGVLLRLGTVTQTDGSAPPWPPALAEER